jgi:hypothetical protein
VFLASCAGRSIEAYRSSFRDGKLRFYWRTVHNLFRSGVALIHCVKNWPPERGIDQGSMRNSLNSCSSILWGMVERYPAGRPCRDLFETLYQSIRDCDTNTTPLILPQMQSLDAFLSSPAAMQDIQGHNLDLISTDVLLSDANMQDFVTWNN